MPPQIIDHLTGRQPAQASGSVAVKGLTITPARLELPSGNGVAGGGLVIIEVSGCDAPGGDDTDILDQFESWFSKQ